MAETPATIGESQPAANADIPRVIRLPGARTAAPTYRLPRAPFLASASGSSGTKSSGSVSASAASSPSGAAWSILSTMSPVKSAASRFVWAETNSALAPIVVDAVADGDVVLVKGSRGTRTDLIADRIAEAFA